MYIFLVKQYYPEEISSDEICDSLQHTMASSWRPSFRYTSTRANLIIFNSSGIKERATAFLKSRNTVFQVNTNEELDDMTCKHCKMLNAKIILLNKPLLCAAKCLDKTFSFITICTSVLSYYYTFKASSICRGICTLYGLKAKCQIS